MTCHTIIMSRKTKQLDHNFELTSLTSGEELRQQHSHKPSPNVLILDSAHSWLICFANFILMTLGASFGRTINMTFMNFVEDFQVTITKASLGFTLQLVCFSLTSMIVTALVVPKTGERITCIIGTTLGCISTLGIGWSPNIACFLFFMAMKGISSGTTSVASIAMISQYFNKRKSFATAVACSGLALGSMGAPPVAKLLIEEYGRQGAFFLLGAIEMNNIGMSMLLRPITRYTHIIKSKHELDGLNENKENLQLDDLNENKENLQLDDLNENIENLQLVDSKTVDIVNTLASAIGDTKCGESQVKTINDELCVFNDHTNGINDMAFTNETDKDSNLTSFSGTLNEINMDTRQFNSRLIQNLQNPNNVEGSRNSFCSISIEIIKDKGVGEEVAYCRSKSLEPSCNNTVSVLEPSCNNTVSVLEPSCNNNVSVLEPSCYNTVSVLERLNSYDISTHHIRIPQGSKSSKLNVSSTWSIISTPVSDVLVSYDVCTLQDNKVNPERSKTNSDKACFVRLLLWFQDAFNIKLFRTWSLRALLLYNATGVVVLYLSTYFPTIGIKARLGTEDIALMLMISGGVDFVSRLAVGAFTDLHILTITQIVAISQFIIGTTCHFSHFYTSFEALMALAVVIGVFGGLRQSLGTLICFQFMGAERYIQALGFQTMTATLSMAIHHPLLSSILDLSGSFNIGLHYVGVAAYLSAIILLLEPFTKKLDAKISVKETFENKTNV